MGVALGLSQQRDEAFRFLQEARKLFVSEGNQQKINQVDQYVQQLANQPIVPALTQPTQPAVEQRQPSNSPFLPTPPNNNRL
jgi:hypothetical protein